MSKPYYEEPNITIYNDDCLEVMKEFPDKSIDLVLTDPPYNIGKVEWDKIKNYVEWMGQIFLELQRILKDNGSFYFFHNDFLQIVELQNWLNKNSRFVFKQLLVWEKYQTNKQYYGRKILQSINNAHKRNYFKMAEYCLFYTFQDETGLKQIYDDGSLFQPIKQYLINEKNKSKLTNKQFNILFSKYTNKNGCLDRSIIEHYWQTSQWCFPTKDIYKNVLQQTGYFQRPYESLRQEYEGLRQEYEGLRYTFNFVKPDITTTFLIKPAPKIGHITPKPLLLIENIIKHSSNENEIILDCFIGSGTTARACKDLGRKCIGIEISKKYCDMAVKRLGQEVLDFTGVGND